MPITTSHMRERYMIYQETVQTRSFIPNLKDHLKIAVRQTFNFVIEPDELKRLDFEVGFLALESIIDTIKSIENETDCRLYIQDLYSE